MADPKDIPPSVPSVKRSAAPVATVDAQHPWLGLVSFTEETRSYFHGREEESAELSRRVQRKLLTVLFGQSGLGKTSILQAGLVPRLRPEGFCPVYVRLDYNPHAPSPAEQIKRAVFRATAAAGTWTQTGSAVTGETLWEFLHHRDDVLKDGGGRTLIPILIFDQFEEIFTLAQSDDAGRRRAQEFLADLADLVENRPPVALEARIDRDEADAARFDFARADYRILISLREDYLAHLEGLKGQMPSVTQNRMRLARMTGAQAVAAVRAPAPHLVSEAVAEAVVRFVAGGADLARAEVEPSLLSLICRELNNTRLAQGHAEISADLLAGSRDTILSEFYERALADQPPGVRIFIEDEMLTDSGFRESVAEERVRKGFAAAGAKPEALALLVDRRLLRVEDRLDLRRVEITHDVLCSVIGASRGVRHEREALEASKRQLLLQQEREAATRRALVRARLVAAVAVVLMVLAAGSAVFGWINLRRARQADAQAQISRALAERARAQSEKLIAFLLEDFYQELLPTGRVEMVAKLADKAVAYYDGLPPELMSSETKLYRGMALVRKASSLLASGHDVEARRASDAAIEIFARMRAEGDRSDDVATALALAFSSRIPMGLLGNSRAGLEKAVGLLRPVVAAGHANQGAKYALADMLQYLAHAESNPEDGLRECEEARTLLAGMGALDLSDLTAASIYADVTDTQSRMAELLGRVDDAEHLSKIVSELSEKVLQQRPGDLRAMQNRFSAANLQGIAARARHDFAKEAVSFAQAEEAARDYTRFNPADVVGWQQLGTSINDRAWLAEGQGQIGDAVRRCEETAELEHDPRNKSGMIASIYWAAIAHTRIEAQRGNRRAAQAALAEARRTLNVLQRDRSIDAELTHISRLGTQMLEFDLFAIDGDYATIHARAIEIGAELAKIQHPSDGNRDFLTEAIRSNRVWQTESALRLGNFEEAATSSRQLIDQSQSGRRISRGAMEANLAQSKVSLGRALLGAGHREEALVPLQAAEAHYRRELAAHAQETKFRQDFARALYELGEAQAGDGAGHARRDALLAEAAGALDGLTFEARQLARSSELIAKVSSAQARARE